MDHFVTKLAHHGKVTTLDIKKRLLDLGINHEKIAARLNVTREAVTQVISGKLKSPRLRKGVARALRYRPEQLWADYVPSPHPKRKNSPATSQDARNA